MNQQEVVRYFKVLSRYFRKPCDILLTGAALGTIYGGVRATLDIDFALKLKTHSRSQKEKLWQEFAKAADEASARTGIAVQYAEDIDRWSSITFLDYGQHAKRYRRFGTVNVKLLEVPYWAIGKLARYLDPDIRDLIQVLRARKTSWRKLLRVAGLALRKSPKSTACFQFRRQVEHFLKYYGRTVWGQGFQPEHAVRQFHQSAQIHK